MRDRPTPETDANECWPASNLKLGKSSVVPSNVARKLERERDEARKEVGNLQDQRDFAMQVISRLERERDEARNKMADALQEVNLRTIDYERMKETLRFILNECDWERLGGNFGGGDERIGKAIRAILNKDEN